MITVVFHTSVICRLSDTFFRRYLPTRRVDLNPCQRHNLHLTRRPNTSLCIPVVHVFVWTSKPYTNLYMHHPTACAVPVPGIHITTTSHCHDPCCLSAKVPYSIHLWQSLHSTSFRHRVVCDHLHPPTVNQHTPLPIPVCILQHICFRFN